MYYIELHCNCKPAKVEDLLGKTLTKVDKYKDMQLVFHTEDGEIYAMYHEQQCCEDVSIEDINGDLDDLIGSPLTMAEESSNWRNLAKKDEDEDRSTTWTFYKFATNKGYITIRWFGTSSGWYSEKVDFVQMEGELVEH